MSLWQSLLGTLEVQVVSADPAAFLTCLIGNGVRILKTGSINDLTVSIVILRKDRKAVFSAAERKGVAVKVIGRSGLYWAGKGLLKRPVLLWGMGALMLFSLYLPTRILFVEVEGNGTVPTRLILEQAGLCGIRFGASRQEVRSEKMKNTLLAAMPELQWAGINTKGCTAVITVREREIIQQAEQPAGISSLVASRDGVISSFTVTRGSPMCAVGQAVKAGQILISGYTDCGLLIQGCRAEGEIFADTHRSVAAVLPSQWSEKGEIQSVKKKYSLRIGKKYINFQKDSGIWDTICDRIYEEKYVVAPGGFRLPIALIVETVTYSEPIPGNYPEEEAKAALENFAERYLRQQMVAGKITLSAKLFETSEGTYRMDGQFACREMIGQVQKEEIIGPNGNTN